MIDRAVADNADPLPDAVVAIGGGSVMDAGKAISAMLPICEPVENYLEGVGDGGAHPGTKIPFIAVPTTAGTGSEVTKNAVISHVGLDGYKKSLRHDRFIPDLAIVDPELMVSAPPTLTAWSGMDAFTQLLESYLSTAANPMTDAIAYAGLKSIRNGLEKAVHQGDDLEARADMAYAALCSGITLANAGLGTVHGFASSVGGRFKIAHGLICGKLMAPVNEYTLNSLLKETPDNTAIMKYAHIGKLFHGSTEKDKVFYSEFLVNKIYDLSQEFGLPGLSSFGFDKEEIPSICGQTSNKNNPYSLSNVQLIEILEKVM